MTGKPIHQRVVPHNYARLLDDYLQAQGQEPETVLGAPWPVADAHELGAEQGMPIATWELMLERAAVALDDPLLGLHLGQTITAQHLGILGAVFLACDNLGAALLRLQRYQRLIFDATPIELSAGAGWIDLRWDTSDYQPGPLVETTGSTVLLQFARSLIRGTGSPLEVRFFHPAAGELSEYETFFGCPVAFEQSDPGLRFSIDLLALPLKSPDPALIALLERHADERLAQLPEQAEIVHQLRKAIAYALRHGEPNAEQISQQLHCSRRTLQRRLNETGTNFRQELNLVRHEMALGYLRDPTLQLVDIALLLGYSEHSAFSRAFKPHCGQAPQDIREQLVRQG